MTIETKTTNMQRFLEALHKLCEEHKASIGGCGCCGSPFVTVQEDDGTFSSEDDVRVG